ncbi:hypothetical protein [Natrialba sp. INN-245]|uniref:hypothetical protein n=1 Tax=Natrialba sp. INN-245 TaxID=2690967 RepID=UPI0013102A5A|nr:hypothetical protein [Natrialba sp. INN-245]MWV39548.1 hypothetical protein [Natrialba sp. INN-245]
MTRDTAVRVTFVLGVAIALASFGTVAGSLSTAPTASYASSHGTFEDNRIEAGAWGIELDVDDDRIVVTDAGPNGTLSVAPTVTNDGRQSQSVTVSLEVAKSTVEETIELEGGERARITLVIEGIDLDPGEHAYVVAAENQAVEGTVVVDDAGADAEEDEEKDGDADGEDEEENGDADGEDEEENGDADGEDEEENGDANGNEDGDGLDETAAESDGREETAGENGADASAEDADVGADTREAADGSAGHGDGESDNTHLDRD